MARKEKTVLLTVQKKLCNSCGLCSNYCHQKAITYEVDRLGFYIPKVDKKKCIACGICYNACPGINDLKNYDAKQESYFYGYSNDEEMHMNASSGGITTELLCYLINHKIVDYVTCVTNRTESNAPEQVLTNSIDVIRSSRTSKYCPVKWNDIISQIEKVDGSVAVVALPCQVNSIKRHYANRKHNIKYFISLLCNHTPSLNAANYLVTALGKDAHMRSIINRGDGFPGYMKIKLTVGTSPTEREICFPFRRTWAAGYGLYFKNRRCYICNDPFAKNADIVMGDSYFLQDTDDKGTTFCIVRNEELSVILNKMKGEKVIELFDGPDESARKKYYKVLFDRETDFSRKNSILSVFGKSMATSNSTKYSHSFHEIFGFYKVLFVNSLGRYHFLWRYLARKKSVKELSIEK